MSSNPISQQVRHILALSASQPLDAGLLQALGEHGAVRAVQNLEEALAALRSQRFDLVVGASADFLPLAQAAGQLRAETILEKIGQGVCIVAPTGQLIWTNSKMRSYPSAVVETVRETCVRLCFEFAAERSKADGKTDAQRVRRRNLNVNQEYYFDLTASPIVGPDERVEQVVALVWDMTATRRLQDRLNAIDLAGRELVGLDAEALAKLDVPERLQLLEEKIIRYSRDLMHFDHFAVRILDKKSNRLDTVLAGGMSEEAKSLEIYAAPENNGISGYVAATGRSYICPDVSKDPRFLPGIVNAKSSLTVPLKLHDQVVGILNVESDQVAAFSEDDRQIAEIFGRYIAIALHILKLLVVERHTTTGQIAADVAAELSAPLNEIVTEATNLIEDYIGHDDLRKRLHGVIDTVDRVKKTIHALTESPGIKGLVPEQTQKDPVIAGKRILIAEDEDVIRETVADLLAKMGAVTVMAADGEEAVKIVGTQRFDLVLSDIMMPNKNGYEVFSAVKQTDIHTPVILITGFGYDPNHSIVRASKEGLAGVLYKPFKVEQLLADVRHALTTKTI